MTIRDGVAEKLMDLSGSPEAQIEKLRGLSTGKLAQISTGKAAQRSHLTHLDHIGVIVEIRKGGISHHPSCSKSSS